MYGIHDATRHRDGLDFGMCPLASEASFWLNLRADSRPSQDTRDARKIWLHHDAKNVPVLKSGITEVIHSIWSFCNTPEYDVGGGHHVNFPNFQKLWAEAKDSSTIHQAVLASLYDVAPVYGVGMA